MMITRKHLLFAIAATSLLTMFLITILPIRSQNAGEYDPWLDWNDDGKINLIDTFRTALAFGTSGDPTKDVTVTNWPQNYKVEPNVFGPQNISWTNQIGGISINYTHELFVAGYSNLYFHPRVLDSCGYNINITFWSVTWLTESGASTPDAYMEKTAPGTNIFTVTGANPALVEGTNLVPFKIKAPYVQISILVTAGRNYGWIVLDWNLYLRNE